MVPATQAGGLGARLCCARGIAARVVSAALKAAAGDNKCSEKRVGAPYIVGTRGFPVRRMHTR